jgi:hypothetical protein
LAILLRFQKAHGPSISKGPFESIVFERGTVREHKGGPIIAEHLPQYWAVDGEDFLRLDVEPPVLVTWERFLGAPSTTGQLHCVDSVAYLDRRMFAVIDRQHGDWYLLREGRHQPVLMLKAVQ